MFGGFWCALITIQQYRLLVLNETEMEMELSEGIAVFNKFYYRLKMIIQFRPRHPPTKEAD